MKEIKDKVIEELRPILTRYQVEGKKEKDKIIAIDSEKLPGLLKVNNYRVSQVEEKKYENNYEGELLQKLDEEADLSIRREAIEELKELRRSEREKAEKNLSDLENETQKECARVIDRIREELKSEIETKKQKLEEVQKAKKQYVSERINIRAIYKQCKPESRIFRAATEDEQEIISKIKEEHKKINELENEVNSSTNTLKAFEEEYGKIDLQNDMSQLINIVLESITSSPDLLAKEDEWNREQEEMAKEENREAARRRIEENREARKRIQEDRQKAAKRKQKEADYNEAVIESLEDNLRGTTKDEQEQYLMGVLSEMEKDNDTLDSTKRLVEKEVKARLEALSSEKTQESNTTKGETTIDIQPPKAGISSEPKAQVKTEQQIKPKATVKVEEPETKVTSTPAAQTKQEPKTEINEKPLDEKDMPISIIYQARKDRYVVKDANRERGIIAQTKKIKVIDKSVLAEELQMEEQDLNYLDLNIVSVLRKLDERNGTNRAEQYINNTLDPKNKDENMQISYDLRGLFRNKEISKENASNLLECANYVKTFELGKVKKGLGTIVGEKVNNIIAQFKNRNLKQIEAPKTEKETKVKKNNFKKETQVTSVYNEISSQIKDAKGYELDDILDYAEKALKSGKISTTEYAGISYNIDFRKNQLNKASKTQNSQDPDLNIIDLDNEDIDK